MDNQTDTLVVKDDKTNDSELSDQDSTTKFISIIERIDIENYRLKTIIVKSIPQNYLDLFSRSNCFKNIETVVFYINCLKPAALEIFSECLNLQPESIILHHFSLHNK
uniref:Alba domain-containing protein n=1 Tax=Parastrongyloides trichosuri TaxID=131310 RepID=A0A0N4Z3P1_PARTI